MVKSEKISKGYRMYPATHNKILKIKKMLATDSNNAVLTACTFFIKYYKEQNKSKNTMKALLIAFLILVSASAYAQLDYSWGNYSSSVSPQDDTPYRIVMDANGYTYIVGTYAKVISGEWSDDIVVRKFDHFGAISTFTYDSGGLERARDLVIDGSGNIYSLGLTGLEDDLKMVVVKFNGSGVVLNHLIIDRYKMQAASIISDNAGNIYALGSYYEGLTNERKGLVVSLNSSLDSNWTSVSPDLPPTAWFNYLTIGNLVFSENSIYMNCGYATDNGYVARIVKYNLLGNQIWYNDLENRTVMYKLAADNLGNIYSAGFTSEISGFPNATLVKYSSAGVFQSNRKLDTSTVYNDMKIGTDNTVYLSAVDNWYRTAILVKYNDGANPLYVKKFNDGSNGGGESSVLTLTNNAVIMASHRVYYYPTLHYSTWTFLCDKNSGENIMTNQNTSSQFQAPYGIVADNQGYCYLMDIKSEFANYSTGYDWFTYCLHYPVAIVIQAITTPGIYIFTSENTLVTNSTSASNTIATLNVNSITGSGNINVGFNSVDPINPAFTSLPPANISPYSWTITKSDTITDINAEVRFDYTQIANNGGVTNPSNVTIWKRDTSGTGSFTELATTLVGTELRATVTSFGEFIFASPTPLPVELSSFTSQVNNNSVKLHWSTASEINNSGFSVERKPEGEEFTRIGFVIGNGTSNQVNNYQYSDNNLSNGKYFYRLKQTDYNGNFKYYNLSIEVLVGIPGNYILSQNYPNPFNPTTKINYDLPFDSKVSLKIYDMTGREIASLVNSVQTAGYYVVQFNASNMASGMYFYNIIAEGSSQKFITTKKMVLVK
ncbi:hypothetical protein BH10BAC5_BH10BAC5_15640 [soil metagenome]